MVIFNEFSQPTPKPHNHRFRFLRLTFGLKSRGKIFSVKSQCIFQQISPKQSFILIALRPISVESDGEEGQAQKGVSESALHIKSNML